LAAKAPENQAVASNVPSFHCTPKAARDGTSDYTFGMLRKFWLFFAQACTLCLAALFVVATLRPDLLARVNGRVGSVIVTQETATPVASARVTSYADAAKKAMPAVVNI
jgi:hypothetical protein